MRNTQASRVGTDWSPEEESTILAQGVAYPFNDYLSGYNDNVLVVGGTGTGKTRSIVRPNLLQAVGSYVVSDPKGRLYDQYAAYLQGRGYRVGRLDFARPLRSTEQYNLFRYMESEMDVLRAAHMLANQREGGKDADRFWEYSAELLLESIIAYLWEAGDRGRQTIAEINRLMRLGRRGDDDSSELDRLMEEHGRRHPGSLAVKCYESVAANPYRTWTCVLTSALCKYAAYDTSEITYMMQRDTLALETLGERPTAIFVVVSDTDRAMDTLVNVFYTQAMQVLCRAADAREDGRLAVPVRFILDDFATNVRITEFQRMISSIRSRGISTMLMIQAEAQLRSGYGEDDATIISNCDTYVYLGGNDVETARRISERCGRPMREILNMPLHACWVFRRGRAARRAEQFDLDVYEAMRMAEVREQMDMAALPHQIGETFRQQEAQTVQQDLEAVRPDVDAQVQTIAESGAMQGSAQVEGQQERRGVLDELLAQALADAARGTHASDAANETDTSGLPGGEDDSDGPDAPDRSDGADLSDKPDEPDGSDGADT